MTFIRDGLYLQRFFLMFWHKRVSGRNDCIGGQRNRKAEWTLGSYSVIITIKNNLTCVMGGGSVQHTMHRARNILRQFNGRASSSYS